MTTINEYIKKHENITNFSGYELRKKTPRVVCADGFNMSVQVGESLYCSPRMNRASFFHKVEVGFPSQAEDDLMPYMDGEGNPTESVYGYVPVRIVDAIVAKHGGIKE